MQKHIIELKHISKSYVAQNHKEEVFKDLSFQFKRGIKTAILGSSGCGKTTLLNLIGGVDDDFEGELLFDGKVINDFDQYRRENISFIFQDLNLIEHHNLVKNITISLTNDVKNKEKKALELLEKVGLLEHADKKPRQLSGGEKQRVAIARALARDTDLLLCDEPTGALDGETKTEVMDLITEVFKDRTMIFITHDEAVASAYADVVLKIKQGHLEVKEQKVLDKKVISNKPVVKSDKTFKRRVIVNLLSKKRSLVNATLLMIVISAIFLLGIGTIKGVEEEIDQYLYDNYKVSKIDVTTSPMTTNGYKGNVIDFNMQFSEKIKGFITGLYANITLKDHNQVRQVYFTSIQPELKSSFESDIVYGKYPEANHEIMYGKSSAIWTLFDHYTDGLEDEAEIKRVYERIIQLTDEELFNELNAVPISYKNVCPTDEKRYYDKPLEIVGIVDDSLYYLRLGDSEKDRMLIKHATRIQAPFSRALPVNVIEPIMVNSNIYLLEEEYLDYINTVYIGYNSQKMSYIGLYIEEENLDLRNKVFDNYILFKHMFRGRDSIIFERETYYKEVYGYKVAILAASGIIALFAILSIYNGIKVNIDRNKVNIGIYRSLGYTTKNIQYMFAVEGLIIALYVTISTLVLWFVLNIIMNEKIVDALDPNRILELKQVVHLDIYSLIGVFAVIIVIILTSIGRELKKVNIINLIRQ